ncbi:MAG: trehalose-phosphatase [Candidatus Tectomicrobia bacterium]|uniref:Trehalose 6-phosphate phosphatase n=1 Tax=Tectimicrobiota bacterium TaxID=2528274 RepID=A0A932CR16_UNCTE|nr:trehalose-phosphatase [Candidatus Tectomicrobia bacterium]
MTKYLFHVLDEVKDRIRGANHTLLLLDYDGTVVPIARTPEMALLSSDARSTLEILRNHPKISLGVISGRALAEIQALIGLKGIYYAGNHGLEMGLKGVHFIHPEATQFIPLLSRLRHEIVSLLGCLIPVSFEERQTEDGGRNAKKYALDRYPGAFLEDKGLSLSLHWRNLSPSEVPRLKDGLELTLTPYADKFILIAGKKVWDVRPRLEWDKGSAVLKILEHFPKEGVLPIYFGDDQTDEDAFKAMYGIGLAIRVGNEKPDTQARYYVKEQEEVLRFLQLFFTVSLGADGVVYL